MCFSFCAFDRESCDSRVALCAARLVLLPLQCLPQQRHQPRRRDDRHLREASKGGRYVSSLLFLCAQGTGRSAAAQQRAKQRSRHQLCSTDARLTTELICGPRRHLFSRASCASADAMNARRFSLVVPGHASAGSRWGLWKRIRGHAAADIREKEEREGEARTQRMDQRVGK